MSEQRTPDAEREALEALLESAGWQVYEAAMLERYGTAAYERSVRRAMEEAPLGSNVTEVVGQINATYAGVRQMIAWPRDRVRALKEAPVRRVMDDAFAMFKRVRS